MSLTFIGLPLAVIGLLLLGFASLQAMLTFVILCGLMGGAAALALPALGGSSIPPLQFVLPFLIARILLPGSGHVARLGDALRANLLLLCYVGYGIAITIAGPRLFKNAMLVPPLRFRTFKGLYDVIPLGPSPQNVTTAVYILGTFVLAVASYVAFSRRGSERTLILAAILTAIIHAATGILGLIGFDQLLNIMRNGNYAQLSQSYGGFIRMNGLFPEASSFANYAFLWFVFLFECWYGQVRPKATGPVALLLALILVFSTSSSAYVAMGAYAAVFGLRLLLVPQGVRLSRLLVICSATLFAAILAGTAALLVPRFAHAFGDMLSHMTLDKSTSTSGLQRLFWAKKGLEAFRVSSGLGIGLGSFRSSSLLTAILGSAGIIGMVSFVLFVVRVFRPVAASTYLFATDERTGTGVAASWALLGALLPASIAAPSADPGLAFALFAGAAMALRRAPAGEETAAAVVRGGAPGAPVRRAAARGRGPRAAGTAVVAGDRG